MVGPEQTLQVLIWFNDLLALVLFEERSRSVVEPLFQACNQIRREMSPRAIRRRISLNYERYNSRWENVATGVTMVRHLCGVKPSFATAGLVNWRSDAEGCRTRVVE
jgi:hypothetical protein